MDLKNYEFTGNFATELNKWRITKVVLIFFTDCFVILSATSNGTELTYWSS